MGQEQTGGFSVRTRIGRSLKTKIVKSSFVVIEAFSLTKHYGSFPAIEDVSFSIGEGEIVGFLGPNGAGKTTTMRILTGFIAPTEGTARIAGLDTISHSLEARRHVGYLPESVPLYFDMTVTQYLRYLGSLRGLSKPRIAERISEVIDLLGLDQYRDIYIGRLSKGFRQRVGLAQAILHEPPVLILDEPTVGIDPKEIVETRRLIGSLGAHHTVLLSSHVLGEVSSICQRVIIIHEGRIVADANTDELAKNLEDSPRIEVEIAGPEKAVRQALAAVPGVSKIESLGVNAAAAYRIHAAPGCDLRSAISSAVVDNGWALLKLTPVSMTLDEIFVQVTADNRAEDA